MSCEKELSDEVVQTSLEFLLKEFSNTKLIDPLVVNTIVKFPNQRDKYLKILEKKTSAKRQILIMPLVTNFHWSLFIGYKTNLTHFDTIVKSSHFEYGQQLCNLMNWPPPNKGIVTQQTGNKECGVLVILLVKQLIEKTFKRGYPYKIQKSIKLDASQENIKLQRQIIKDMLI